MTREDLQTSRFAAEDQIAAGRLAELGPGESPLIALVADEPLVAAAPRRLAIARLHFYALLVLALFVHAALIAAFLWRDSHDRLDVARADETPIEVIVEPPPPEQPKLPQQKPPPPPPPPKPKEDLSPAFSAPRAPNEDTLKTERTQPKTSVPKAPQPPSEGTPQPKPQMAQPKDAAPPESKEDTAAKEEDNSKPDAEALDKAKPKVAKEAKTKAAKAAPKQKKSPDLMASLAGSSALPELSFAKPTPKAKVYGGTEDVRWMSEVEGMLEAKVTQLPRTQHWHDGGHVLICFHVDETGRVTIKDFCQKSGYPDIDQLAMRALLAAAPFPPPPRGVEHGLVWSSVFDGQLPSVHVSKQ